MTLSEPQITLRRAAAGDASAITSLTDDAYAKYIPLIGRKPQPMTVDYVQMVSENPVWLLFAGEQLVGVLVLVNEPDTLLIYSVAVSPAYQKQGLGRRLLSWAEEQAIQGGYQSIRLYTNELFTENIQLYERLGYQHTRREPYLNSILVHMAKSL
jgi:ribosomal protein S18 acetylase RimI-like enzyme